MRDKITVTLNGEPISGERGKTLSELINGEKPCGGHGRCGKCKILAKGELSAPSEAEKKLLSDDELANDIRLGCLTLALGDCEVESVEIGARDQIVTDGAMPDMERHPGFKRYGVAIDIGTTTLAANLYDFGGNLLAQASRRSPQQEWGADVISRIEAALDGKALELAVSVRQALDAMIPPAPHKASLERLFILQLSESGDPGSIGWPG